MTTSVYLPKPYSPLLLGLIELVMEGNVMTSPLFDRMSIVNIFAREILDSRGNPTVEVDLHTSKG